MKRPALQLLILAATATISCAAYAQIENNAGIYSIASGNVVMKVDANKGGKIISLQINGKEALAQHRKIEGMRFENPNDYGSTFWPAPQSEWNWPPIATYDSKPYEATVDDKSLTLVSGKDAKYPYVFSKTFSPMERGSFQICYAITNASDQAVSVAPWEITRVASGGKIYIEAEELTPAGEVEWVRTSDGVIAVEFVPAPRNRKIFADGKGWITHENDGLRFTKSFPDIDASQAAPGEAEVEVYYNQGETYTEIENQGAYQLLQPGESLQWTVTWTLSEL